LPEVFPYTIFLNDIHVYVIASDFLPGLSLSDFTEYSETTVLIYFRRYCAFTCPLLRYDITEIEITTQKQSV
jgi:hypothetical protein